MTEAFGSRESYGPGDFTHANTGHVRKGYHDNNFFHFFAMDNYAGLHWRITITFNDRDYKMATVYPGSAILNTHSHANGLPAGHVEDVKAVVEPDTMFHSYLGDNSTVPQIPCRRDGLHREDQDPRCSLGAVCDRHSHVSLALIAIDSCSIVISDDIHIDGTSYS